MDLQYTDPKKQARIDEKIESLKRREEEDLAQMLSSKYGIPYVDLTGMNIETDALRLIPEEVARGAGIAAFRKVNKTLYVGIRTPNKTEIQNVLKDFDQRGYVLKTYLISTNSLERAWSRYKDISFATEAEAGTLKISNNEIEKYVGEVHSLDDAKTIIADVLKMNRAFRVSKIVEMLVSTAIASGASDIHVEPEEENTRVRYRIDGILQEISLLDSDTYKLLLARIKLLSGLKINIKEKAQDGRFSVKIGDREIEIRSSVLPGNYGESIVMRLLDPASLTVPIHELGISKNLLKKMMKEVDKPDGMILNTGPTGSGKTTTLYSFLNRKKTPGIKIITVEDPIEYHLSGIVQTQVDNKKGYDFANGLRSSLRQDPDVIMVGEIRDLETAETAVHASLTGHLVFSTLHTNNAAGAFPRLIDLGVNSKILTSAINMIIAQRLVRKLCPHCKKEMVPDQETTDLLKNIFDSIPDSYWQEEINGKPEFNSKVFIPGGCEKCNNLGYKGRIGIFEIVLNSAELEDVVQNNPSEREIKKVSENAGLLDMTQDGVLKILNGITSLDEVRRVVDIEKREGHEEILHPDEVDDFLK